MSKTPFPKIRPNGNRFGDSAERRSLGRSQSLSIIMIASVRFPAIVGTAVVTGTRLRGAAESFCGHNGR